MAKIYNKALAAVLVALAASVALVARVDTNAASSYGLSARPDAKPYLKMPKRGNGKFPFLLSETGAFKDTAKLVPSDSLIPYNVAVSFWSDGATKLRWINVPKGAKIKFAATGEWSFPKGTVFVKNFELPTDESNPSVERRLETRLLVLDRDGGVYGATYKWRDDNSDADLLRDSLTENIPIKTADGKTRIQTWYYPSPKDCLTCHTARAGGVLGVKTRQMNRDFAYASGITDNQLRAWNHVGLFEPAFDEADLPKFEKLATADDKTRSLEDRARSYLDANCAQCHRPGGTVAYFDARYDTPLNKTELIDGPVLIDQGVDRPRVVSPHDIWRSIAYMRVNTAGDIRMPPVARETIDEKGVALLREWIEGMPGRPVLAPPTISPVGGNFDGPVEVTLKQSEPGAEIRYTTDGSVPERTDILYTGPIKLDSPTVLRAGVFKDGFTRSITEQEVFIIAGK